MKSSFSVGWKTSTQRRKQRKYRHKAPLHVKQKFTHSHLSPELKKKYSRRSLAVRKGDTIRVLRGQFKKKTGKVSQVSVKKIRVFVEGVELVKKDGTKTQYALNPSNIMITDLITDDKRRGKILQRGKNVTAS